MAKAAVVLGASGSVGNAVIAELIRNGGFAPIVTLERRALPDQVTIARETGIELRETLVPTMDPGALERASAASIAAREGEVVGLSVLGIGAGTGLITLAEHRALVVV